MTPVAKRELLPGMLDMLVLKTLTVQDMHGYGIIRHLEPLSNEVIRVEEGSLFPALQRMRAVRTLRRRPGATAATF